MAELPTGTVTFLFTDVEGSTELLIEEEIGERIQGYAARVYAETEAPCAIGSARGRLPPPTPRAER